MISAIITDFDGTLVDTFEANFHAYQEAFSDVGLSLSREQYQACFGVRFERFMASMGIGDQETAAQIKAAKKKYYPKYFQFLKSNTALLELLCSFKATGGKTAVASTASKENLMNVLRHLNIADHFDLIFAGMDVREGKPSPEIYLKTMDALQVRPEKTLIFEDSEVGILAARASGAHYMIVPQSTWER